MFTCTLKVHPKPRYRLCNLPEREYVFKYKFLLYISSNWFGNTTHIYNQTTGQLYARVN